MSTSVGVPGHTPPSVLSFPPLSCWCSGQEWGLGLFSINPASISDQNTSRESLGNPPVYQVGVNPFSVLDSRNAGSSSFEKVIDLLVRATCL